MLFLIILSSAILTYSDGLKAEKEKPPVDYGIHYGGRSNIPSIHTTSASPYAIPNIFSNTHQNNQNHHNPSDTHTKNKHLNKFNIQQYITQRDIERQKKGSGLKTYFAEILAASILLVGIIIFICWWNFTKRGRTRSRGGILTTETDDATKRMLNGARSRRPTLPLKRGASMPEFHNIHSVNLNLKPLPYPYPNTGTKNNKNNTGNYDNGYPANV